MPETGWTPELVAERLAEAADVLARLPEERVRGFYDLWPRIIGAPCRGSSPAAAMPDAIDRMGEALSWLLWLDVAERQLVWLRAEGLPWNRPNNGLAALDHSIAQDLGPAQRGQ